MDYFDDIPFVWHIRYEDNEPWVASGTLTKEEALQAARERRPGVKVVHIF